MTGMSGLSEETQDALALLVWLLSVPFLLGIWPLLASPMVMHLVHRATGQASVACSRCCVRRVRRLVAAMAEEAMLR